MSAGENIRRVLRETGIYTLTGSTPVDQEISAYEAGFSQLEAAIEALEADLFALTATDAALSLWETLYQGHGREPESRRKAAAAALSCRGGPVTAEKLPDLLLAAGIKGTAQERDGKLLIPADFMEGFDETEAKRLLGRLLPTHLLWELVPAESEA